MNCGPGNNLRQAGQQTVMGKRKLNTAPYVLAFSLLTPGTYLNVFKKIAKNLW